MCSLGHDMLTGDFDNPTVVSPPGKCRWCGQPHGHVCPYVKAIEFDSTGLVVKRVEFHDPQPLAVRDPLMQPARYGHGPMCPAPVGGACTCRTSQFSWSDGS